jgi:hypothetical protein
MEYDRARPGLTSGAKHKQFDTHTVRGPRNSDFLDRDASVALDNPWTRLRIPHQLANMADPIGRHGNRPGGNVG